MTNEPTAEEEPKQLCEKMDVDQQPKIHVSIQKGFSIPPLQKCNTCCNPGKYHCPFCSPGFFKPTKRCKVKNHLDDHLKRAFYTREYTIHRCRLECRTEPHYHCMYCVDTMITKSTLTTHLPLCIQAQQKRGQNLFEVELALRQRGQTDTQNPGEGDTSSNDRESDDHTDEMAIDSDSQDQCSIKESSSQFVIPVISKSNECDTVGKMESGAKPDSAKRHQTVQTDFDKPQDCDEFYFMTLVKMFKRLAPQKKTAIRMKIERLLFEAEFQ